MKHVLAIALLAIGLATPISGLTITTAAAADCSGSVPEAWKRPGGFCDQQGGATLSGPNTGDCTVKQPSYQQLSLPEDFFAKPGARVHLAITYGCDGVIIEEGPV